MSPFFNNSKNIGKVNLMKLFHFLKLDEISLKIFKISSFVRIVTKLTKKDIKIFLILQKVTEKNTHFLHLIRNDKMFLFSSSSTYKKI